jgi:hypothetical protein
MTFLQFPFFYSKQIALNRTAVFGVRIFCQPVLYVLPILSDNFLSDFF